MSTDAHSIVIFITLLHCTALHTFDAIFPITLWVCTAEDISYSESVSVRRRIMSSVWRDSR